MHPSLVELLSRRALSTDRNGRQHVGRAVQRRVRMVAASVRLTPDIGSCCSGNQHGLVHIAPARVVTHESDLLAVRFVFSEVNRLPRPRPLSVVKRDPNYSTTGVRLPSRDFTVVRVEPSTMRSGVQHSHHSATPPRGIIVWFSSSSSPTRWLERSRACRCAASARP